MQRTLCSALFAGLTAFIALLTGGSAAVGAPPPQPKVLVIGIDGLGYQNLIATDTPNLDALVANGSIARAPIYAPQFSPTVSGPGWATIGSGVWPDKHRIYGNDLSGNRLERFPDFLTRIEQEEPSLNTFVATDWDPLSRRIDGGPVFSHEIDKRATVDAHDAGGCKRADGVDVKRAVSQITNGDPDATFVYLGSPDEVAHHHGYSPEYTAAIRRADARIGQLMAAIQSRETLVAEDWLVMVTTDHGHVPQGGHGGSSPEERASWVAASGGGVPVGGFDFAPRIVDVAASALTHLGVVPEPGWKLDGRSLAAGPIADPFEEVSGDLGPAEDEDLPPDVIGWTHETPSGWTIDNSAMPAGGVEEWRGWSFTDDDFWTRAAPDQEREGFVRSRGVIAVADTDEWDDAAHDPGEFDSTLISPPYDVSGADSANLVYGSHYRQSGNQQGKVSVSFDGGPEEVLVTYGNGAGTRNKGGDRLAKVERIPVTVPPGSDEMTVEFRLAGADNDWYWAIDAPQVEVP